MSATLTWCVRSYLVEHQASLTFSFVAVPDALAFRTLNATLSFLPSLAADFRHCGQTIDASTGKTIPFGQTPTFSEVWSEMEELLETHKGKVRSIGCAELFSPSYHLRAD